MSLGSTPSVLNETMIVADTQYPVSLAGVDRVAVQCRTAVDVRYAFETGKVATPTAPYGVIKAGQTLCLENLKNSSSLILYLASSSAGAVVEITTQT